MQNQRELYQSLEQEIDRLQCMSKTRSQTSYLKLLCDIKQFYGIKREDSVT